MKKIFLSMLFMPLLLTAQVKTESDGKVKIGTPNPLYPPPAAGTATLPPLMLLAGTGAARVTFGDHGNSTLNGNVFVGEWTDDSTDKLWLHGKNGIYFTNWTGLSTDVLAYYNYGQSPVRFVFNTILKVAGMDVGSDLRYKENVKRMKENEEMQNPLFSLSKLNGVTYNLIPEVFAGCNSTADISGEDEPSMIDDPVLAEKVAADKALREKHEQAIAKEAQRVHFGFVAQDLQQVYPELVTEDEEGYLSINYIGLIPVIVEAMKEQNAVIAAQSEKIKELESKLEDATGENPTARTAYATETPLSADDAAAVTNAFLYQNAPNPFNTVTTIRYFLPTETGNATLYIFDLQGRMIESYPLNGAGEGQVQISASGLQPGMYIYSLLINGKEIDTKRMVITQ